MSPLRRALIGPFHCFYVSSFRRADIVEKEIKNIRGKVRRTERAENAPLL